mgnify:CR=1 FL=1
MKPIKDNTKGLLNDLGILKAFHYIKLILVVLFIIIEDIAWTRIGEPIYNMVKSFKVMDRFKLWINDINHRYLLLGIFLIPFVFMEASSIYAGKALMNGTIFTGIGLYTIKLILTAPVVIIFNAGKDILLTFWIVKWPYGLIIKMKRSKIWNSVKTFSAKAKVEFGIFKDDYLNNSNGDFMTSFKKIYKDLKNG